MNVLSIGFFVFLLSLLLGWEELGFLCMMMGGQLYIFLSKKSFLAPLTVQGLDGWAMMFKKRIWDPRDAH